MCEPLGGPLSGWDPESGLRAQLVIIMDYTGEEASGDGPLFGMKTFTDLKEPIGLSG